MQLVFLSSALLLAFTLAPFAGLVAALAANDRTSAETFLLIAVAYLAVSGLAFLATNHLQLRLTRWSLFVGAIFVWFLFAIVAMPPFIVNEGHGWAAAFFESTSAITTMGHSLVPGTGMKWSMIVYRTALAWLGGLLTLVLAVFVLARYNVGGTGSRDLRLVFRTQENGNPAIFRTIVGLATPYLILTLVGALALMATRVTPSVAILTAMNAMSTNGGHIITTAGTWFNNLAAEVVLMVLMLIGATSILFWVALMTRRVRQLQDHTEVIALPLLCLGAFFAAGTGIVFLSDAPWQEAFSFSRLFDIVSTATTSGLVHDSRIGLHIPFEFAVLLVLVGGTAFSTAGGMKAFRVLLMLEHASNDLQRLVYPDRVMAKSHTFDPQRAARLRAVWSTFYVTLLAVMVSIILLSFDGFSLSSAFLLAVGSLTNTASLVGEHLFDTADQAVSVGSIVLISILGIAGRLELLVILAALNRWR